MLEYTLQKYYINYLLKVRKLKESSINHYLGALSIISKMLQENGKISGSIYEVIDIDQLSMIKEYLYQDEGFKLKDAVGHNMYSAALNNYYRFAQGEEYMTSEYEFDSIDIPLKISETKHAIVTYNNRSSIIKIQSIKAAHYLCELDNNHKTFTAKSNLKQYMEGHHLIPLKEQNEFEYSLDIYANVVCLCPICHRLLHYGIESEKREFLEHLFISRESRLGNSGIELSKNDFLELTM